MCLEIAMLPETFFVDTLLPHETIGYYVHRRLREIFPDRFVLEATSRLALEEYARAGECMLELHRVPLAEIVTTWEGSERGLRRHARNGWYTVGWRGRRIDVLLVETAEWDWSFVLAPCAEVADDFYRTISQWEQEPHGEVLVFNGHHWHKDETLYRAIRGSTIDNLVLEEGLKEAILADVGGFFAARTDYEAYGVPWKRGILFLGPPGNGKTHAVKAIVNATEKSCLYVKSMPEDKARQGGAVEAVFAQARRSSPCVLVLEDLDALVKPDQRSSLLNELDGFAANTGILTLATTNHPERLDPALIDRPSRFDRKYHFRLPSWAARTAYIAQWNASLRQALRITEAAEADLATRTEEFSFAYLKELFLSATMRWMATPVEGTMQRVLDEQVELLRGQMPSPSPEAELEEGSPALLRVG